MPKAQPKNAFYYFMLEFRDQQKSKGINYPSMREVATAAGPIWKDATAADKSKYENLAKKAKEKLNILDVKFTSTGIPLSDIERQRKELEQAEANEKKDIQNFVKLKCYYGTMNKEDIYLMDVNYYCKTGSEYLIGEVTVLRFNLLDGIKDHYHEIINPGGIPVGYASDVKIGSEEFGLDLPDENDKRSNYMQILANIIDYLKQQSPEGKILPPIFTLPEKVIPVQDFIFQMCTRAAEDDSIFRIYKLDFLFFTLINAIKTRNDEGFPRESLALAQLRKDPFKYTPGIGCEHHETLDKGAECSTSRTKRWAYAILDSCCPVVGIDLEPGKHLPYEYDMEGIHTYKEQKKVRAGPSVAGSLKASTSRNSSIVGASNESSFDTSHEKKMRTHTPLRMPKTDFSQSLRPAPEITEGFPALVAGHGRGRSLSGSLNKMKLDK